MERSVIWFTFLILWLAVAQANIEEACEQQVKCLCIERYVQAQYCEADFVVIVNVTKYIPLNPKEVDYEVEIKEFLKATPEATQDLNNRNLLRSPAGSGLCGLTMNIGETWLVGGKMYKGQPTLSSCELGLRWPSEDRQKGEALLMLPHLGCINNQM